ncbi:hypothetical protein SAMN02910369_01919 [Lachnospiraceae bacterium NE2001]|nr:hypothetical protein SAMN02910369_01919 [Lachnospiraceae bacterium NE2001]
MDYNKFKYQNSEEYVSPYRDLDNIPQNNQPHNSVFNRRPVKRQLEYSEADKSLSKTYLILALVLQFLPWLVTAVYYFVLYKPNYVNAYTWFPDDESFEAFLIVAIIDCITFIMSWIFMLIGRTKYPAGKLSKATTAIFIVMLLVVIISICMWIISCIDACTRSCPG